MINLDATVVHILFERRFFFTLNNQAFIDLLSFDLKEFCKSTYLVPAISNSTSPLLEKCLSSSNWVMISLIHFVCFKKREKATKTFMKDVAMLEESFALVKSRSRLCYAFQVAAASFYMEKAVRNGFHGTI